MKKKSTNSKIQPYCLSFYKAVMLCALLATMPLSAQETPTAYLAGVLQENTLNGATITIDLENTAFITGINSAGFTINNALPGLSIASIMRNSATKATITLAYDNTDTDLSIDDISIVVDGSQLVDGSPLVSDLLPIDTTEEVLVSDPLVRSGYSYNVGAGPSTAKFYAITATSLTAGGGILLVEGTEHYEVSTTNATTGFGPTANMPYTGTGDIAQNKFWVRLKSGLPPNVYNGETITITGGNAYTEVTANGSVIAPVPGNDLCSNPATVTVNGATVQGTLAGATFTTMANANNRKDVWYKFTPACTGTHTITVSAFTGNVNFYVFNTSCPADNATYVYRAQTTSEPETVTGTFQLGTTYYIRVGAYDATDAAYTNFSIAVITDPVAPAVTAGGATNVVFNAATIQGSFTMGCAAPLTGYGVEYSTTSGFTEGTGTQVAGNSLAGTNFTASLLNLTPATTYYYRVYAVNNSGTAYSTLQSFSTPQFVPETPVAINADAISGTGFTARWNAVPGAEDYRLDVSISGIFESQVLSENFFGFVEFNGPNRAAELNNYLQVPGWTGIRVFEVSGATRIGSSTLGGTITTPGLNLAGGGGNAVIKLDLQKVGSDATTVVVEHSANGSTNWIQVGAEITPVTAMQTYTLNITGGTNNSKIRIRTADASTGKRFYLDNVQVLSTNIMPGYNNLSVDGTSQQVTGLDPGNSYFYRVRSTGYGNTSANSNTVEVVTGDINVWNGTEWTGGNAPTIVDQAIIEGNYNTATNGAITAQRLVVNSGTFTVASGTSVTVENEIINNAGVNNFIVENNANLIQNNDDAENFGAITIKRKSSSLYRQDYTLWGSPVAGQNLFGFSPLTVSNRFYTYNTATDSYNTVPNLSAQSTTPFGTGVGYLIRMPNGDPAPGYNAGTAAINYTGIYNGIANNGLISVPVANTGTGFNAIANPYPSPISIEEFMAANPGLSGTIYFWRKNNSSAGTAYCTATATDYVSNGEEGADDPDGIIQVGQGFIVQTMAATNAVFDNSMRVATTDHDSSFFRQNNNNAQNHRVWIDLMNAQGKTSQMLIAYRENATMGIDNGIDAKFINDAQTGLNSLLNNDAYVIQGRALPFSTEDVVPLQFKTNTAGSYTIAISRKQGLFGTQAVYLKDKQTNTLHNLSGGSYSFTTEPGIFNNRFEIVYNNVTMGNDDMVFNADKLVVYNQQNVLAVDAGNEQIIAVNVYDTRGRLLFTKNNINATATQLAGFEPQQQVLLVEVTTADGKASKKVIF